jgi:hypothetical protein
MDDATRFAAVIALVAMVSALVLLPGRARVQAGAPETAVAPGAARSDA